MKKIHMYCLIVILVLMFCLPAYAGAAANGMKAPEKDSTGLSGEIERMNEVVQPTEINGRLDPKVWLTAVGKVCIACRETLTDMMVKVEKCNTVKQEDIAIKRYEETLTSSPVFAYLLTLKTFSEESYKDLIDAAYRLRCDSSEKTREHIREHVKELILSGIGTTHIVDFISGVNREDTNLASITNQNKKP